MYVCSIKSIGKRMVIENKGAMSTEEKIMEAARKVFHAKGFAATRTRDIAEEAGINLALLNYYFKSKQKLFAMVMEEAIRGFISGIKVCLTNENTTFEEKLDEVVSHYIDMILKEPLIPNFIISELNTNPDFFADRLPVIEIFSKSVFLDQYKEYSKDSPMEKVSLIQLMINMVGMTIFPFVAKPVIQTLAGGVNDEQFRDMMLERKKLIPIWIKSMIK